jgi:hypothetical protein
MQEAIRDFIKINRENMSFEEIEGIIDVVKRNEIERAKKKQLRQWRKLRVR